MLSGKSSEEKEMTRVDSGLGEWDSESSRKTSFSSQGRLSPDFGTEKTSKVRFVRNARQVYLYYQECSDVNNRESGKINHNKSTPRRRRSGIDMMSSKPPGSGDLQPGGAGAGPPVVKTRLPKIAKSSRATGVWSRKISPAGVSYLKMDDEVSTYH